MKKFKKWLVVVATITLSVTLAACSKTVATMKGGKITESEYYNSMKKTSSGKQVLQQMILDKLLESDYGKKVSDKQVDKQYNSYKKQYGSTFNSVLSQSGYTASSFKKQIRSNLLLQEAVKANTKVSNAALKKQWAKYEPKVTVAHILVAKKSTAEDIVNQLKKDGSYSNFKKLAKKYSTDSATKNKGGKLASFNNTDTSLVSAFKNAAFKLKTNQFTETPVKTTYGYHIIFMINNPGKGTFAEHKAELKKQIIDSKSQDSATLQKVVAKILKDGDVSIKDKDLKNILSDYLSSSSNPTSAN